MTKLPWEKWELDTLSEAWKKGGMKVAQEALPHRTSGSIRCKAEYLCIKVEGRAEYRRQESSELIDAALRKAYCSTQPNLKKLSKELDRTVAWLKLRAGILGVRRPAERINRKWEAEEDKILSELLERGNSISVIHNRLRRLGYSRSLMAIQRRAINMKIGFNRNGWTASEVAEFFSIESHAVIRWINKGWLSASRATGQSRIDPDDVDDRWKSFVITDKSISKFMVEYPHAWDHRRMNIEVLFDLLRVRRVE